jgi:hypothetical protein
MSSLIGGKFFVHNHDHKSLSTLSLPRAGMTVFSYDAR